MIDVCDSVRLLCLLLPLIPREDRETTPRTLSSARAGVKGANVMPAGPWPRVQ